MTTDSTLGSTLSRPLTYLPLLALPILAAALPAQISWFVGPSKALLFEPGGRFEDNAPQQLPFWGSRDAADTARVQYLYDVDALSVKLALVKSLQVRSSHLVPQPGLSFQTEIVMSMGPLGSRQASPLFAANLGVDRATVFSGRIDLPATGASSWPAPWAVRVPLASVFTFLKIRGRSYVVEFTTRGLGGRPWVIEGYTAEYGGVDVEYAQSECFFVRGGRVAGVAYDPVGLVPGGDFTMSLQGYPPQTPSLATNALFLGARGVGSMFGPWRTPFPLTLLGLRSDPRCAWAISSLAGPVPMVYEPDGGSGTHRLRMPVMSLPNTRALVGASFLTQALAVDHGASIHASPAHRWRIGSGDPIPVTRVGAVFPGSRPAVLGTVEHSNGATLRFDF